MLSTGKIFYSEEGNSSNSLICLHGIGGDDKSFEPQLKDLSSRHRVISWNMPGYKGSKTLENYSFENLCYSLNEFLSDLKIDNTTLIGQSIGGMLAQEFFFRYPNKVNSLILIATTSAFGGKDQSFKKAFLEKRLKPLSSGKTMKDLAKSFVPSILAHPASQDVINSAVKSMENIPADTYKKVISCLVTFDRYNDISKINIPCCLISGSEDNNSPSKTMKKMSDKLSDCKYYNINNAGHLVNLESPKETNEIIVEFLENLTLKSLNQEN